MRQGMAHNPLLDVAIRIGRHRHLLVPGAILLLLTVLVVPSRVTSDSLSTGRAPCQFGPKATRARSTLCLVNSQ